MNPLIIPVVLGEKVSFFVPLKRLYQSVKEWPAHKTEYISRSHGYFFPNVKSLVYKVRNSITIALNAASAS